MEKIILPDRLDIKLVFSIIQMIMNHAADSIHTELKPHEKDFMETTARGAREYMKYIGLWIDDIDKE